jgi:SAM-dependent methyltransferase
MTAHAKRSRSTERNDKPWTSFSQSDATNLGKAEASCDVVVSTQVAEYVPDIAAFCREAFRVLKPGGRGVIMATNWEAVAWHSEDQERMETVMAAFAPHCVDSVLPRTLAPRLRAAGFVVDRVSTFPILNLDWSPDNYSCLTIPFIVTYIKKQGSLDNELLDDWAAEQRELADRGEYYFLSSRIYFEISKPSLD